MKLPAALKPLALHVIRAVPPLERRILPSAGYRRIDREELLALAAAPSAWTNPRSAEWQQRAYDRLLAEMGAGNPRADFRIAAEAVDAVGFDRPTLLEVSCGGGYHSAVFAALARAKPHYIGSDYSPAMLDSARRRFPGIDVRQGDTTQLPFEDDSFDIVFEGVSLMHIPDYRKAIAEIARVARSHAIFHCLPIFDAHPTEHLFKYAYGEPATETIFSRAEVEQAFADAGLTIKCSWHVLDYDVYPVVGAHSHFRTYLCRIS
jgi:ubiquinone/menaquinone biosynthesis C-methylase UbiE